MAGEIDLGQPDKGAHSVLARISFNCKVEARVSFQLLNCVTKFIVFELFVTLE